MTYDGDAEQAGVDAHEREEDRRLAAEHQALYAERVAAIEAAKANKSPLIREQHRAEKRTLARIEAEREAIELHQSSDERWAERWAAKSGDPRWVLPDEPRAGIDDRCFDVTGERGL